MHTLLRNVLLMLLALALLVPAALSQTGPDPLPAAEQAFRRGDYAAALEGFRGVRSGPRVDEATYKAAFSLERLHREPEARDLLEEWLPGGKPNPWKARGWILLGDLQARDEEPVQAERAYARALKLADSRDVRLQATLARGRLLAEAPEFRERRPDAEADLVEVIRRDFRGSRGAEARLALGDLYLANPQVYDQPVDRAVDVWRELAREQRANPLAPEARARSAKAFASEARFLDALEDLEALVRDYPSSPQATAAAEEMKEIRAPRVELVVDRVAPPGRPPRVLLRARNVGSVQLTAWPVELLEAFRQARSVQGVADDYQPTGEPTARWVHAGEDLGDHAWREADVEVPVQGSGAFVIRAESGDQKATTLLLVSRLALVRLAAPGGDGAAWLVDGGDGKAAGDSQVLRASGVDEGGRYGRLEDLPVGAGGLVTLPPPRTGGGSLILAKRGADYALLHDDRQPVASDRWRTYFHSDRPTYQPGDKVRWKAVVRARTSAGYESPAGGQFLLRVQDPRGGTFQEATLTASANGTLRGDLSLPENAPGGIWSVSLDALEAGGARHSAGFSGFRVQEARAPQLQVTVRSDLPFLVPGDPGAADVEVRDANDRPVAGVRVDWTVRRESVRRPSAPEPALEWFGASPETSLRPAESVASGRGRTDRNGRLALEFPLDLPPEAWRYTVRARAVDASGRSGEGRLGLPAGPSALFLDVRPEGEVRPDRPLGLRVQARDLEGRPVAAKVDLTAQPGGKVGSVQLDARGQGSLEWTPSGAGPYRFTATAPGVRGPAARATLQVGPEAAAVSSVAVSTDRELYRPGDVAHLVLRNAEPGRQVLLTLEGREVARRLVVTCPTDESRIDLPIGEDLAPSFRLRALTVEDYRIQQDDRTLLVPNPSRVLTVRVAPTAPPVPGQAGRLRVETVDSAGKPVPAEVSLSVAGPSPSAGEPRISLPGWFYGQVWESPVGLTSSLDFSFASAPPGEPAAPEPASPPATAANQVPRAPEETAFWSSDLRTDDAGTAEVGLTWPERAGTWTLTARAVATEGRLGEVTAAVDLRKDVQVRLSTPAFLTEGDTARVSALLLNAAETAGTARVTLTAEGLRVEGNGISDAALRAGGQERLSFGVAASKAGAATLHLVAQATGVLERTSRRLLVLPLGVPGDQVRAGSVEGTASGNLPAAPAGAQGRRLSVHVSAGYAGLLTAAVEGLKATSPGTVEATISRSVPAAVVARTFRDLSLPALAEEAPVREAVRRLQATQNADGGWSWWPEGPSDPRMTAYALSGLSLLRAEAPAASMERANAWLRGRLASLSPDDRAYALAALARAPERALLDLARNSSRLQPAGRFHLALALQRQRRAADARRVLREARAGARRDTEADTASWSGGGGWTEVEATAAALEAHLQIEPDSPLTESCARWLAGHRKSRGWGSSRETALATLALAHYLQRAGEEPTSFGYGIWLNGNEVQTGRLGTDNWVTGDRVSLSGAQVPEGPLTVEVRKAGPGRAWWCAELSYTAAPVPTGLALQRSWFRLDAGGKRTPVKEGAVLKVGEVVEEVLEVQAERALRYLVVEDHRPAGLEALPPPPPFRGAHVELADPGPAFYLPELPPGTHRIVYRLRAETPGDFHAAPATVREAYDPSVTGATRAWRVQVEERR